MRPPSKKKRRLAEQRASNLRALYRSYRKRASNRGLPFDLTPERFRELTKSNCLLCNAKPKQRYKHDKTSGAPYIYNGIDRIDNDLGYVDGNCAPCCATCNYAKGTLSLEQHLLHVNRVYEHAIKPALKDEDDDE